MTAYSPNSSPKHGPHFDSVISRQKLHLPSELFWLVLSAVIFSLKGLLFGLEDTSWENLRQFAWLITGLIGLSYLLQVATKRFVFFSARNVVLFGIIYWILSDVIQMIPAIYQLKIETAAQSMMYVFLFTLAVQAGYLLPPFRWIRKRFLELKDPHSPNFSFILLALAFCIGAFPYFYYSDWSLSKVIEGILSSRYYGADVGWRRDILGDERVLVLSLDFFFVIFPSLVAFYVVSFRRNWIKKMILIFLTAVVWMAEFYMGTRQVLGFVVLAPMLTIYLTLPQRKRKFLLLFFSIGIFILSYLMEVQVYKRSGGFLNQKEGIFSIETREPDRYVTVDDNFCQFSRLIDYVPKQYDFVYFGELWYLLTRPVPRFLWEDKPVGFGWLFARDIIGVKDMTYSYSVLGDFYVSFGVVGIILGGILFGMLSRNLDQLIPYLGTGKVGAALYTLCLLTIGMAVRSLQIVVFFGYYSLAFFIIAKISTFSFKR